MTLRLALSKVERSVAERFFLGGCCFGFGLGVAIGLLA